jgi:hypothetical protein
MGLVLPGLKTFFKNCSHHFAVAATVAQISFLQKQTLFFYGQNAKQY